MADKTQSVGSGTLLRGPDGYLYFISDEALRAYRLSDKQAEPVSRRAVFDRQILGVATTPAAVRDLGLVAGDDVPTTVTIVDLSATRPRQR
jgi:hypothetical protein